MTNEDGLHVIDSFDTDDFRAGHDHQPISGICCFSNIAAKLPCRPAVGGQHHEHALALTNRVNGRLEDGLRTSGHDHIDGKAHRA